MFYCYDTTSTTNRFVHERPIISTDSIVYAPPLVKDQKFWKHKTETEFFEKLNRSTIAATSVLLFNWPHQSPGVLANTLRMFHGNHVMIGTNSAKSKEWPIDDPEFVTDLKDNWSCVNVWSMQTTIIFGNVLLWYIRNSAHTKGPL